ncbi:MAG TPA: hypothetical protein DEQ40_19155, partial [Oxalobacteraceae bacterium]|nr:hypothetical protein [Oxalobacteraceae bacterium]
MDYEGFIGPAYRSTSLNVSADRVVNWYPEVVPTGVGKSRVAYFPTPGTAQAVTGTPAGVGRGLYAINGRTFAVIGSSLLEFFADGTFRTLYTFLS